MKKVYAIKWKCTNYNKFDSNSVASTDFLSYFSILDGVKDVNMIMYADDLTIALSGC